MEGENQGGQTWSRDADLVGAGAGSEAQLQKCLLRRSVAMMEAAVDEEEEEDHEGDSRSRTK